MALPQQGAAHDDEPQEEVAAEQREGLGGDCADCNHRDCARGVAHEEAELFARLAAALPIAQSALPRAPPVDAEEEGREAGEREQEDDGATGELVAQILKNPPQVL